tara:strand:+ start:663 stop:4727 length:4065 start_codon:yes stop_codon:yes gene_type:complete
MPYIGNNHIVGDHVNNFKVLDDISSYTETFDGTATSVVSAANETIRVPNHRFIQGQRVIYTHGGGSNIPGLSSASPYYIIFDTNNTFKLATSVSNATNGTAVNITGVAPGGTSHTINASFDGFNTKFKITHTAGKSARFTSPSQLSIAINNVIQRPNLDANNFSDGFAIQHKEIIVFKTAPGATEVFWGNLIGETIESFDTSDLKIDNFTGDGSTTEFTLSKVIPNNESVMVSLDGVLQHPTDSSTTRSYTVIANILSFTAAPANGVEIQARHLGFAGAATGEVTGFYGRSGNVALTSSDHITTGDITSRNINSSGIITASSFSGPLNATTGTFSGDVSIGGTLTYEDVKNIDSVGIITARDGIEVTGGDIKVGSGVTIEGNGQATFTGIVTFGSSSTTIDGDANTIKVGTALTLGHTQGLQFHTQNLHSTGFEINNINASGIITAASFSGSTKTGLGTALNADDTNPLSNIFYTDNLLGIGATVTVDHPSSAAAAFTRYGDIRVDDTADLIIADGDDFIPDVLGLADFGTLGGGASQGRIRVNTITNSAANGAPTVQNGLIIAGVTTFSGAISGTTGTFADDVNITGGSGRLTVSSTAEIVGIFTSTDSNAVIDLFDDDTQTRFRTLDGRFHISADHLNAVADSEIRFLVDGTNQAAISSEGHLLFNNDTDTYFHRPDANRLAFVTGGTERLRIDNAGRIGIGTDSPDSDAYIHIVGPDNGKIIFEDNDNNGANLRKNYIGIEGSDNLVLAADEDNAGGSSSIKFRVDASEKASIGGSFVNIGSKVRIQTDATSDLIFTNNVLGIGTNAPSVGKLHIDGDADTDLLMLDTYAAGNYAQVRGSNQSGIRIRGGGSYGGGMIDFGGGLRGTDPGVIKFHAGTDVTASNDEHMRIQANGEIAMTSSGSVAISDALANLHVQNGSFRVSNAAAPSTSHIKITARGDSDDGDYHAVTIVNNNLIEAHINKDGRIWSSNSITAGRTRTDAASPTNYYHNGGHTVAAYSGRTDSSTAYRTLCFIKAWDGGDTGDRNAIYFVDSGSDTTTADYDGHQKFGIKANGQAQFGQALYVGRVESDEGAPDSVYNTGERGVNCYANDATDETYVLARNVADSSFIFYSEVNGEPNVEIEADGSARTDGTWSNTNADYAEMFEWVDGNTSSQERRGMTVVLDGDKIKLATDSDNKDNIIGVVSANPVIVGDSASMGWHGRYKKDAFDAPARKSQEFLVWYKEYHMEDGVKTLSPQPDPTNPKTLNKCSRCKVEDIDKMKAAGVIPDFAIENNIRYTDYGKEIDTGNYDPTKKYIPRMDRKEWDAIGLVGKLVVKRGQPVGSRWILMKSNVGVDPNDNSIVLDKYLVR